MVRLVGAEFESGVTALRSYLAVAVLRLAVS